MDISTLSVSTQEQPTVVVTQQSTPDFTFPGRKSYNTSGVPLNLAANYFKIEFLSPKSNYFKYSIDFEPELPGDSLPLRRKLFSKIREQVKVNLGHVIFNNTTVFSRENYSNNMEFKTEHEGQEYTIILRWASIIDPNSVDSLSVYKKFFNLLVHHINFVPMKRNYFNPFNKQFVGSDKIEIWPGFNSTLSILNNGILLNMNVVHRILRNDTVLDIFAKIQKASQTNEDFINDVNTEFKGSVVLTRYNGDKTYIIDEIDFTKTPNDSFETKEGPITFIDYYKKKYGKTIREQNQPLLLNRDKKKNKEIYLIPEFCFVTGITDEMRSNFNLMKEIATITKGGGKEKMEECRKLINTFRNNEKCKKEIETWGLTVSNQPMTFTGLKLPAGNILLGGDNKFPAEDNDIDRKIQNVMLSQPPLQFWAVISNQVDLIKSFVSILGQVKDTFKYPMDLPKEVIVNSTRFRDWEEAISTNLNEKSMAVVLIIPGNRGKGPLYNDLKRLLLTKYPLPSQIILSGTMGRPKGLRSVINKVLIQICAKIGGEPWGIDYLPCTKKPTMLVAVDSVVKGGKNIMGLCATYNNRFTKYVSYVKKIAPDCMSECFKSALTNFKEKNSINVSHIVMFRDGVSPTQVKKELRSDLEQIRLAMTETGVTAKLTYVMINKKSNVKLFNMDNTQNLNTSQGTLVDNTIVSNDMNDFYLISQKSTQGLPQASHYYIVYDDFGVDPGDMHSLVYKLCFLYYNWTGSVKTPAPCKYAHKISSLIADKICEKNSVVLPNDRFHKQIRSLYFL